jgi:predicted TIM-barrel fold metal-dependent hydrolase
MPIAVHLPALLSNEGHRAGNGTISGWPTPFADASVAPSGPMIIDWHSHWIPKPLAERVARHRPLPPAPEFFDVDMRLRHMDASGILRQVVSWPVAFGFDALLTLSEVAALYREYNDSLAGMVAAHPDRFCGLAAVPTADPQRAADELARARSELGLIGAVIPADAFLTPLSAHAYSALLGEADRHRSHLYVHP